MYIIAAILMFIQTAVLYVGISLLGAGSFSNMLVPISAVFAFVFLGGAFFARTGTGVTATTERYVGGGYYSRQVETANAITCGCMSGIGSLGLTGYALYTFILQYGAVIIVAGIPGLLSSVLAMYAGGVALVASTSSSSKPVPAPEGSRTCPFCGKGGISPAAQACPSCGQPLQ